MTEKMKTNYPSVRFAFTEDLKNISSNGVCLLPEWICYAMSESVINAGWIPLFYPVCSPESSSIPCQLDVLELLKLLQQYNEHQCVLLLAHPLGYIDPNVDLILNKYYNYNSQFKIFLDLAQSYGEYDFSLQISKAHRSYISFNGRKLINSGGAIAFSNINTDLDEYNTLLELLKKIASKNFSSSGALFERLSHDRVINLTENRFNTRSNRSAPLRTVLQKTSINSSIDKLQKEGIGQSFHPTPQYNLKNPSNSYLQWERKYFLFFHQPRELTNDSRD
ncbi:MAG: hypothetical protein HQK52_07955 [Oligoflexia bacterium]|nr:hypothetical protein [Oligoflexia bacterium]